VLDTLASLQAQITAISNFGYVNYVGTWNANTNSPTITSGSGDKGDYYVVSVAGSTSIDGQTLWGVGDWIIFNGVVWQKVDGGSTGDFTNISVNTMATFTYLNDDQAVFTNSSAELVSKAVTGTGNVVLSASPTLTGTINAAGLTTSSTVTHNGGTANGVAYLNGSKVLTTGSVMTFDGSNLTTPGLATTVDASNLTTFGRFSSGYAWSLIRPSSTATGIEFRTNAGDALYQLDQSSGANKHIWYTGSEQMRLTSTGLGIGTSSPGYKLHVVGTGGFANNGNENLFLVDTSGSTRSSLQISGATNYFNANIDSASHGQYVWRSSNAYTERMRLDSSGNLGIGTTSPATKLQVYGTAVATQISIDGTGRYKYFEAYASGTRRFYSGWDETSLAANLTTDGAHPITFSTNATERARIDSSGNLVVGGTSAVYTNANRGNISINGASTALLGLSTGGTGRAYLYTDGSRLDLLNTQNDALTFGTNNTERARITSGGEVYIAGTTDQGAYNLQVNGTGVWGAGAYVNGSDRNLKDNIQSLDSCLDVVVAMRPVTFQYKPEHSKDQSVQPGFIAQELQEAMAGKAYIDGVVQAGPEYLNVAYQNIIPILVKAIQELKAEFDAYKATHP
jgi:hypothetical protein